MKQKASTKTLSWLLSLALMLSLVPALNTIAMADVEELQSPAYSGGTGTEADPYLITTVADWKALADTVNGGENYPGKYFRQTADLDMSGAGSLNPVGTLEHPFAGHYEGDGFAISNAAISVTVVTVDSDTAVAGIFGVLTGKGSISNLRVIRANATATTGDGVWDQAYAGGLVAFAEDCTITDCSVSNSIITASGSNNFAGAFVGFAGAENSEETTFSKCASENNAVNTMGYGGGFIGAIVNDTSSDDAISFTDCYSANNTADAGTNSQAAVSAFLGGSQGGNVTAMNCFVYGCNATATGTQATKSLFNSDTYFGAVNATNCYYCDTNDLPVNAESAAPKTADEMKSLASALGEAFTQGSDYPILLHPVNLEVSIEGWTYGEDAKTPSVARNSSDGTLTFQYKVKDADDSTYSETVPTNAGDYTVKATVVATNTHKAAEATADFAIAKANATSATVSANNRTYDGTDKPLVTVDGSTLVGGEMQYALGTATEATGDYTTSIPTATDAGTYYVWYKAVGDANHTGSEAACVTVTVAPAPVYDDSSDDSDDDTISVPVSSDSGSTSVGASVSGSTAAVQRPSASQLDKLISESVHTGEVTIDVSAAGKGVTTASIPTETIRAVEQAVNSAANDATGLTVKLPEGSVTLDAQALTAVAEQAKGATIQLNLDGISESSMTGAQRESVQEMDVQAVYDAYMTSNGSRISDFHGGKATVAIPYTLKEGQNRNGVLVWYIADNGDKTEMPTSYDGKEVSFTTTHFSNYVVVYDAERAAICPQDATCPISKFVDADASAWYHDGVHWALDKGVMNGVSPKYFNPNGDTSRAMVVTMLWRMEGSPAYVGASEFFDVENTDWYGQAVRWASAEGIVEGYRDANGKGQMFNPNGAVTREQLAAILYRYAQFKKADVSVGEDTNILSYDDAFSVSTWAMAAMQWAVDSGIINGIDSNLVPAGNASRAQVATMLMRYSTGVNL